MIEWSSPGWLWGLVVLPLVWALHKLRARRGELAVSAVFLWRFAASEETTGSRWSSADPAWRRRALILALLILAEAGARWTDSRSIEIWLDDSVSMLVDEGEAKRHEMALQVLREALEDLSPFRAVIHSLTYPGRSVRFDSLSANRWEGEVDSWFQDPGPGVQMPLAMEMGPDAVHWLVTDGADSDVNRWADTAPLSRIVQVGRARDNLALTALALRPSLKSENGLNGVLELANTGDAEARRTIELYVGEHMLRSWSVVVSSGGTETLAFDLPDPVDGPLIARSKPADALAYDDELALAYTQRVRARLFGACGRHLSTALSVHPALTFPSGDGNDVDLAVVCGNSEAGAGRARLRFQRTGRSHTLGKPVLWTSGARELKHVFLDHRWLRAFPAGAFGPDSGKALLAAGSEWLIASNENPSEIDVRLDMEFQAFAEQPEYP
ncbi:BatA domain-containing protein, partial [Methylocaldum sp.]|uniref:BatA domain-containing protein n=1 Tax=Methylocaldum sp. TaxID=1969727 RepID=UPI00321FE23B